MNLRSLFGKAKSEMKDLGEGDKDLLETMESEKGLGVIDSGQPKEGPKTEAEYERGEDMLADMERDMEHARNRRMGDKDDDTLGIDLSDLD